MPFGHAPGSASRHQTANNLETPTPHVAICQYTPTAVVGDSIKYCYPIMYSFQAYTGVLCLPEQGCVC
jgi:hypothetical protein